MTLRLAHNASSVRSLLVAFLLDQELSQSANLLLIARNPILIIAPVGSTTANRLRPLLPLIFSRVSKNPPRIQINSDSEFKSSADLSEISIRDHDYHDSHNNVNPILFQKRMSGDESETSHHAPEMNAKHKDDTMFSQRQQLNAVLLSDSSQESSSNQTPSK